MCTCLQNYGGLRGDRAHGSPSQLGSDGGLGKKGRCLKNDGEEDKGGNGGPTKLGIVGNKKVHHSCTTDKRGASSHGKGRATRNE